MNAVVAYGQPPTRVTDPQRERVPPQNLDAEQALLGAVLANNRLHESVSDLLRPEHFFDPLHGRIYAAIGKIIAGGRRADPISLKNLFDQDGALAEIGGAKYLVELAQAAVPGAEGYAAQIIDLAKRRKLIELAETAIAEAHVFDPDTSIDAFMSGLERGIAGVSAEGSTGEAAVRLDDLMADELARIESMIGSDTHITGVPSGLSEVDRLLGGFQDEDLIVLAGRPSMGKSALAFGINSAAGKADLPSAFYSMEMGARQIANRKLSEITGISVDKQRRGDVGLFDLEDMKERADELKGLPVYIDATPALTVPLLRAKARYMKQNRGVKLVVIDYIQLMRGSGQGRGPENRVQEISEITRGLKAIAKELKLPVIALSQLSRAVEQRDDKRPQLADLRESGSIEQDADVVMFVYRDEYYVARAEPKQRVGEAANKFNERMVDWGAQMDACRNKAEIIVAKQRQGPISAATVAFDGARFRFSDLHQGEHS